jgi:hypothetical protein
MNKRKNKGWFSVLALTSLMLLLLVGLGVAAYALNGMKRAQRDKRASVAFQAAQAGLEFQIGEAYAAVPSTKGSFLPVVTDLEEPLASIAPGCTGSATVTPNADASWAWVTSTVSYAGYTTSVRALISCKDVGIWNNAVFAGSTASGNSINGNVDVRGSVHILGEGEPYSDLNGNAKRDAAEPFTDSNSNGVWDPGEAFTDVNGDGVRNPGEPYADLNLNNTYDPPVQQTELNSSFSGNAHIGNNYTGMSPLLSPFLPELPKVNNQYSLSSEVRVKHGMISLQGSATIGQSGVVDGGLSKGTVDGVFVSDGFTGNPGAAAVFSDNGASNNYDLENVPLKMPVLSGIGSEPYVVGAQTFPDHETYLDTKSLTVPVNTIVYDTPAFSYGPDANGNLFSFTPASGGNPAYLTINGVVRVLGDLQIGSKNGEIRYQGSGTIFTKQNLYVDGDLLPRSGFTFPTTAKLGLIAKRNMYLAAGNGSSQLTMAGAFFAQGTIVSAKQNQIAGTFVASYYDMGTNVPNIYQVPALTKNMPPAMPGDKSYYTIKVRTWRER